MAITDDILDDTLRHAHYLERYKSGVVNKVVGLLNNGNDKYYAQIYRSKIENLNRRDVDKLLVRLKKSIKAGYEPVVELLDGEIRDLGESESRWQKKIIDGLVPIELDWEAPSEEQIYASVNARPFEGLLLKDWYKGLEDGAFRRVKQNIMQGYVEGQTTDQIVRNIRDVSESRTRRAAETAVRTALAHTSNIARNESYRRNRRVIKAIEWVATLDNRTTAVCRARDGMTYPYNKGPRPPAHAGCRSTTIPVLKSLRQLGIKADEVPVKSTRASMNGQVSNELNYDGWLRKQPVEFQDDVLGVQKGRLFRKGLTMERFVDKEGREFTLKQLESREKEIWGKVYGTAENPKPQPKPSPQPKPRRKRKQVFDESIIPMPKNLPQAKQMILDFVAFDQGIQTGSKPDGLHDVALASKEVIDRFNLPKMKYFGNWRNAPVRYRERRTSSAAFSMDNDHFLIKKNSTDRETVQTLFLAHPEDFNRRKNIEKGFTQEYQRSVDNQSVLLRDVVGKVRVNPSSEVQKRMNKRKTVEYSPVKSVKDIGYHENGHRFHGFHLQRLDDIMSKENVIKDGWSFLASKYGQTNHREYIAETFTIYMQGDEDQFYRIHPKILQFYRQQDQFDG